jgi:hypothetical protein
MISRQVLTWTWRIPEHHLGRLARQGSSHCSFDQVARVRDGVTRHQRRLSGQEITSLFETIRVPFRSRLRSVERAAQT